MMPKGLITQVGMFAVSIGIILTYVEPAFTEISEMQDTIVTYQAEIAKVSEVNTQLNTLVAKMQNVSIADQERLVTYMPDTVDKISVPRDLLLITKQSGAVFERAAPIDVSSTNRSSRSRGVSKSNATNENSDDPKKYQFEMSVQGNYLQLKSLFGLLEQNDYPLEVDKLSIIQNEGGFLKADITLTTYGQK